MGGRIGLRHYGSANGVGSGGASDGMVAAGIGATLASAAGAYMANKAKKKPGEPKEKDDEPDLVPADSKYQDYISATGANKGLQQSTAYMPGMENQHYAEAQRVQTARDALNRIATMAQTQNQTNDLAAETRMGGRYTGQGLQLAEQNANLNAQDRIQAKSLIGGVAQDQMRQRSMIGIGGTQAPNYARAY